MEELQKLELTALMDMLAMHTADYTRMLAEGVPKDKLTNCKTSILRLQSEIESRKQKDSNTSLSNTS